MAKVSDRNDAPPQIGRPVGSLAEVKALGVPTRNIATCSAHTERENMGCPVYELCDRRFRDTRPQNEVGEYVGAEGDLRRVVRPCFDWVKEEAESYENGTLITIIGYAGDPYTIRGSEKKHRERDPNCNDCSAGKCVAYVDRDDLPMICPEFPAAAVHQELQKFARKLLAKAEGAVRARKARTLALLGGGEDDPTENEPLEGGKKHGKRS